jgi:DNA polymerase I
MEDSLWYLDIETTLDHKTIHCVVVRSVADPQCYANFRTSQSFATWVEEKVRYFVGHNILGFDAAVLKAVWGIDIYVHDDSLVMSRLWNPVLPDGHSLGAWGVRLGYPKGDNTEEGFFDQFSPKLLEYCERDTELGVKVYYYLKRMLEKDRFARRSVILERNTQAIIAKQERNGFLLDVEAASNLIDGWQAEYDILEAHLQESFEPNIKVLKTKTVTTPFNPGSRQQIADRLQKRGWVPKEFTPTGQPIVNDDVLENVDIPEAKDIHQYLVLGKRITQVKSWIEAAGEDGRVHGKVITIGAITGRMTHSGPNMAQVPASYSPYGKECRGLWIAPEGKSLVGVDASGLELRMLAHYLNNPFFTESVCHGKKDDGTDIHSVNMRLAGLDDRDMAKTLIYLIIYGGGPAKAAKELGCSEKKARQIIDKLVSSIEGLQSLRQRVAKEAKTGSLPGLDGRRLIVRSEHSALNTLLQGAGAIVMKQALVILDSALRGGSLENSVLFVANVHDEWQMEVPQGMEKRIGKLGVDAIEKAGIVLSLRCPLTGEWKHGKSWKDTH